MYGHGVSSLYLGLHDLPGLDASGIFNEYTLFFANGGGFAPEMGVYPLHALRWCCQPDKSR
jgi:hypothetical protein